MFCHREFTAFSPDGRLSRIQEGFRRYRNTNEPDIGRSEVTVRIVNEKQDVRFYYESTEGEWVVLQPGMDVSSMTTVGWHALRPALFTTGSAEAGFRYFHYRPLEP
jgi:beta-xylosidase